MSGSQLSLKLYAPSQGFAALIGSCFAFLELYNSPAALVPNLVIILTTGWVTKIIPVTPHPCSPSAIDFEYTSCICVGARDIVSLHIPSYHNDLPLAVATSPSGWAMHCRAVGDTQTGKAISLPNSWTTVSTFETSLSIWGRRRYL